MPVPKPKHEPEPKHQPDIYICKQLLCKNKVPMHSKEIPGVILQVNGKWRAV